MTKVILKGLRKEFGKTIAVEHLDLEVKDKEFVCLLGPSGCGKTTTLNCIAGLENPTSGEIYFDDNLMNDIPSKDRGVGLVFQTYALFRHMTVFDNLAFPMHLRKSPSAEIKKEVEHVAKFLRIEHLLRKKIPGLAMNEMQRVAIGRTLLSKPKILLLDEPLSSLDALSRATMRSELKRLALELEQNVIYVTHDQSEALSMADRVAVMSKGVLQQYDTPYEIYTHPKNKFVADFIGSPSMNFIPCTYQEKDGKALLIHEAFTYDITELKDQLNKTATTSELILGIRPEAIRVTDKRESEEAVELGVFTSEPLGSKTLLTFQAGKDLIRGFIPMLVDVKAGVRKYIEFDKKRIRIFDGRSEEAIV